MCKVALCHMVLVALFATLVWPSMPVLAQVPGSQPRSTDADAFDFIFTGMRTERLKLISGVCHFTGTYVAQYEDKPEQNLEGPIKGFLAIDGRRTRYDMTRPGWVVDRNSVERIKGKSSRVTATTVKGTLTTMYADDDIHATYYNSDNFAVSVVPAKDFANPSITYFNDIRGITLYDSYSIAKRLTLEQLFDNLVNYYKHQGKVTKVDESTYVVTWGRALGNAPHVQHVKWTLVVDVASGFTPKSYRFECALEKEMHKNNPWTLVFENKTEWQKIHNVWVPSHHKSSSFSNPYGYGRVNEKTTLDFRWESVSEPVNKDLFTYATFKVPGDMGVMGQSGWIRKPKGLDVVAEQFKPRSERSYMPIVVAVILGLLVIIFVIRRIRKKRMALRNP